LAFLENPENKEQVNHKDKNPKNNNLKNLEWCTSQENCDHRDMDGMSEKHKQHNKIQGELNIGTTIPDRIMVQGFVNGILVYEFDSMMEAERQTRISHQSISNCCNEKEHCKSAGKFEGKKLFGNLRRRVK
jgi:hypothetical protein